MEVCYSYKLDVPSLCCATPSRQNKKQPPIDATMRRPWYLQHCVKAVRTSTKQRWSSLLSSRNLKSQKMRAQSTSAAPTAV